ncbi:hypothetical protein RirG_017920 [Rhizophagus irregularis DAOM 197198w]|uniref:Uncharacterized protein n=2 Tax=Rhizophagus irregularis TaxID=588596 RepID=A0A015KER8_RHIIW|nr:hypothetical protein RirG_017920 [Rhizophagus irregularis DAOM 197198w]
MEKLELAIANEQARQEARKAAGKAKPLPELDEETSVSTSTSIKDHLQSTRATSSTSHKTISTPSTLTSSNNITPVQTDFTNLLAPTNINSFTHVSDVYAAMQSRYEFCLNIRDAKFLARQDVFLKRSPPTSEDETSDDNKRPKSKIISDTDTSSSGSKRTRSAYSLPFPLHY